MIREEYDQYHSALIKRGNFAQKLVLEELSKYLVYGQSKRKINVSDLRLDQLKKLDINTLYHEMEFLYHKEKAHVDFVIQIKGEIYIIELKSGSSHNDNRKSHDILKVLRNAKKYIKKNYDIKGKHIHLVLLITDNYSIKIPTGNVDIYNLENLQYILELPKDFTENITKQLKYYDISEFSIGKEVVKTY